jgi:GNAT superfamily N-acetyltransferase
MTYSIQIAAPEEWREAAEIDDDASSLFVTAGLSFDPSPGHPYFVAEKARWARSAAEGWLFFGVDDAGARVGFAALGLEDGAPYLDQLSVRRAAMGKGAGRFLLRHAVAWATDRRTRYLWLATYDHLPWNRPFYEREGFRVVSEVEWGPDVRRLVAEERAALPAPEHRVVMRRQLG